MLNLQSPRFIHLCYSSSLVSLQILRLLSNYRLSYQVDASSWETKHRIRCLRVVDLYSHLYQYPSDPIRGWISRTHWDWNDRIHSNCTWQICFVNYMPSYRLCMHHSDFNHGHHHYHPHPHPHRNYPPHPPPPHHHDKSCINCYFITRHNFH